jgi:hypothetical protein
MQLIAGRTAQEYNQRKSRQGAFREDRYHATAIEADEHLHRCLVYIDLNRVRAGAVNYLEKWKESGFSLLPRAERFVVHPFAGVLKLGRCRRSSLTFSRPARRFPVETSRGHCHVFAKLRKHEGSAFTDPCHTLRCDSCYPDAF